MPKYAAEDHRWRPPANLAVVPSVSPSLAYPPDEKELKNALSSKGHCTIRSVLSSEEARAAVAEALEWRSAVGTTNDDVAPRGNIVVLNGIGDDPTASEAVDVGIYSGFGSGHCAAAWSIRSLPRVRAIFRRFFGTDDLLSSLDGMVLWDDRRATDVRGGWFHLDHNPRDRPEFGALQGLVNLMPLPASSTSSKSDYVGGTVLVEGSHKLFPCHYTSGDAYDNFYKFKLEEVDGDDWLEIDGKDHALFCSKRYPAVCPVLAAGDVLLWDSRTVHCSYPINSPVESSLGIEVPEMRRAAFLVSMAPASGVSAAVRDSRRAAVKAGITTTHWIDKCVPLGHESRSDAEYSKEKHVIEQIRKEQKKSDRKIILEYGDLTEEQLCLIG